MNTINNNYYKKYLKYKIKYLDLLNGGTKGNKTNRPEQEQHHQQHHQQQHHQQHHKKYQNRHHKRQIQKQQKIDEYNLEYNTIMSHPILTESLSNEDHIKNQAKIKELIEKLRKKQENCIYQSVHDFDINEIQKQKDIMVEIIRSILPDIKNIDLENYIKKALQQINIIVHNKSTKKNLNKHDKKKKKIDGKEAQQTEAQQTEAQKLQAKQTEAQKLQAQQTEAQKSQQSEGNNEKNEKDKIEEEKMKENRKTELRNYLIDVGLIKKQEDVDLSELFNQ